MVHEAKHLSWNRACHQWISWGGAHIEAPAKGTRQALCHPRNREQYTDGPCIINGRGMGLPVGHAYVSFPDKKVTAELLTLELLEEMAEVCGLRERS